MNAGNVAAFACGMWHPQLGDKAPCLRSKYHPGDHRSEHGGSLKTWTDAAVAPVADLDERTETWREPDTRTLDGATGWDTARGCAFLAVCAVSWLLIVAALVKYLIG